MSVTTLNEYQNAAASTAIYPGPDMFLGHLYCILKMVGEVGETAEKYGKLIRDARVPMPAGLTPYEQLPHLFKEWGRLQHSREKKEDTLKELGDILWYVAMLAKENGFTLEQVANANVEKLFSRKERGVLGGSGDNR